MNKQLTPLMLLTCYSIPDDVRVFGSCLGDEFCKRSRIKVWRIDIEGRCECLGVGRGSTGNVYAAMLEIYYVVGLAGRHTLPEQPIVCHLVRIKRP